MPVDLNLVIILTVKQYPVLYDKKCSGYYVQAERNKAFTKVTDSINENLQDKLTSDEIKKRWEAIRKSYSRSLSNSISNYYLANEMEFLDSHIKSTSQKRKIDSTMTNDSSHQLTLYDGLKNIQHVDQAKLNIEMKKNLCKENNSVQSKLIPKKNNNHESTIPLVSGKYKTQKDEIENIERDTSKLLEVAAKQIANLTEATTTNLNNSDSYSRVIKQALMELPQELIFDGVCGILDIIETFSSEH